MRCFGAMGRPLGCFKGEAALSKGRLGSGIWCSDRVEFNMGSVVENC